MPANAKANSREDFMAFTVTVTPNQLAPDAVLEIAPLNALGTPTVGVTGALAACDDVAATAPAEGQPLVWDATAAKWKPGIVGALYSNSGLVGATVNLVVARKDDDVADGLKVDINANAAALEDSTGVTRVVNDIDLTLNAASAPGPNALDIGTVAAGWYYVWIIFNGTTAASLLSQHAVWADVHKENITGYTWACLISEIHAESPTQFQPFIQVGRQIHIKHKPIFNDGKAAVADTWEILTDGGLIGSALTNFRAAVGPLAKTCEGNMGTTTEHPARCMVGACLSDGTLPSEPIGRCVIVIASAANPIGENFYTSGRFNIPVTGGAQRNLAWRSVTGGAGSAPTYRLELTGYSI